MSENLFYYLEQNKIDKKDWEKIAKATAEWLESRKQWSPPFDEYTLRMLLTDKAFNNKSGRK